VTETSRDSVVAPHPTLDAYYGTEANRERYVRQLFDRTSQHYEWIDNVLSFGSGIRYREKALRAAGLTSGMKILDVATGTGVVAAAATRVVGESGLVVGMDPSIGMLTAGKRPRSSGGVAEALPFKSEHFDFLSMGYALRHVADLKTTFEEYRRVLKPGGKLLIMEISKPQSKVAHRMLSMYMGTIVPLIVRIGTRSRDASRLMQYYWETTEQCVAPTVITDSLTAAGFQSVKRDVQLGMFSDYTAVK
jgi:demethylmenaquinone methyltransferase / 2-methoxy-6-polyprenyl-1,4-benzoquinol methylase